MSPDDQFQWNWWLNFAIFLATFFTGIATFGAVLVALFHDWLRHNLLPPKLCISLSGYPHSTTMTQVHGNDPLREPIVTESLWFHVEVSNERRFARAEAVQLMLVRVEEPDSSGVFSTVWIGEVPLTWQHMYAFNTTTERVLGHPIRSDLISCTKQAFHESTPFLRINTIFTPNELAKYAVRAGQLRMRLTIQARSLEVDSDPMLIEIAWDGTWSDDLNDMARRLVVKKILTDAD